MELGLAGKTAIITGGSAGIGLACAKALYDEGVSVVITARDADRLEAAVSAIKARRNNSPVQPPTIVAVQGDMSLAADVQKVVDTALSRLGKIDILINNAGSARAGAFLSLSDEAFMDAWNLKLLGYIRMVRAVAPHMIERKDGRIVNIIGAAGRTPGAAFLAGSTANAGLLNFTRGISKELAQHNVRINAISPGSTATQRAERLAEQNAAARGISIEEYKAENVRNIPLGKLVDPDEIAAMALLLVSDRSASITGIEILIDGGTTPGV